MNQGTGEIICTAHGQGKMHYFRLFKHSRIPLTQTIKCLVDQGYQGIKKLHANSQVPQKKPRKGTLSDEAHIPHLKVSHLYLFNLKQISEKIS